MKKFISSLLCVMMLVSLFAVTTNASIVTGEPVETIYVIDQDYQDLENDLDFAEMVNSGSSIVADAEGSTNNVLKVVAGDPVKNMYSNVALGDIPAGSYTFEFDVKAINPTAAIDVVLNHPSIAEALPYGCVLRIVYSNFRNAADWSIDSTWYTYRIIVNAAELSKAKPDKEMSALSYFSVSRKVKGTETWENVPYNYGYNAVSKDVADQTPSRRVTYRLMFNTETVKNTTTDAPGISFALYSGTSAEGFVFADVEYLIDNVKLSYVKEAIAYPAKGVMVDQNFDGDNKALVGGDAVLATKDGNNYLDMYKATKAEDTYNAEKKTYAAAYGNSATVKFDSLPQNFVITADICMMGDNTQPFNIEYFTDTLGAVNKDGKLLAGETRGLLINPDQVEAGKWYTVKFAKVGKQTFNATLKEHKTGEVRTFQALTRSNISGSDSYNRLMLRICNGSSENDTTFHWLIDNFQLNEVAALAISNVEKADGAISASMNVDTNCDNAIVMTALYDGDRVVDVAYNPVVTSVVDGAQAVVTVEGDYDKAISYVWDGNFAPVGTPWDITEVIAD